ncbi:MAG: KAP family NTPase [Propionibacteriaceae bacterium]|nr:KAP family NTPase [Propionibacteriaceae bacterium]
MASDGELESLGLDALGRASIAKRLASLILHQDPPFTLGIDGEWGSGKSTLMNFVDDQLWYETTGVNPESRAPASRRLGWAGGRPGRRMVLVRLNLWEHQHDENPVVALLQAARDTLPPAYRAGVSAEIEGILAACASAVALGVGDILVGTSLPTAVGIRDKLGSAIAGRDGPFSTQETQATLVSMFQDAVETVLEVHAADRIVFVVDDLDRCMPDVALDLLEKVHLFFRQVRCIFVLGVDTDILKLTVTKRYTDEGAGERASDYAEKYVEKIITFPYALPPVTDLERRIYLSRLLNSLRQTDAQEGLSGLKIAEILETWTAGLGENAESLRRTKRLANTFILHQRIQNPESDATKLADGDRVAPPPHAGGVLGTTPASSEDQAVADDTQSRTHMTLVYHGGVNHEVTAPSSILYPATKDFDPWILAAVTAIQILAPRDFKELAGPTGDTAIERWFFPKEKS